MSQNEPPEGNNIPDPPPSPALTAYWAKPVHDLAALTPQPLSDAMKERHRIFSLHLMALVARYWNGNKYGAQGYYPFRERQRLSGDGDQPGLYRGACRQQPKGANEPAYDFDYLGHNIGCLAVDGTGRIVDFDFNHNEVLDSSVEHAESRLVRRVFSLAQLYGIWATGAEAEKREGVEYSNILRDVTIYTSLESCAQCAGIMALGQVKEIVYLQTDPGMYWIGRILYNLTHVVDKPGDKPKLPSPRPIAGNEFDFEYFTQLDVAFRTFSQEVSPDRPFFVSGAHKNASVSVTSFLCTDAALAIFEGARAEYESYVVKHPALPPELEKAAEDAAKAKRPLPLTNEVALAQSRIFYDYAITSGNRGTAHKL